VGIALGRGDGGGTPLVDVAQAAVRVIAAIGKAKSAKSIADRYT
jgi:hypothetical protein